jgi:hypothetical protein
MEIKDAFQMLLFAQLASNYLKRLLVSHQRGSFSSLELENVIDVKHLRLVFSTFVHARSVTVRLVEGFAMKSLQIWLLLFVVLIALECVGEWISEEIEVEI